MTMGIKNFTWKKFAKFVYGAIFVVLVGIVSLVNGWGMILGWIKSAVGFLSSPVGRDLVLLILIGIGLLVIYKRRKDTTKKPEEIEVREEAIFFLELVGAIEKCEQYKDAVFHAYKEKFSSRFKDMNETTLNFNATINWLKREEYIKDYVVEDADGFDEYISIEDKGFDYLDKVKKKMKEE